MSFWVFNGSKQTNFFKHLLNSKYFKILQSQFIWVFKVSFSKFPWPFPRFLSNKEKQNKNLDVIYPKHQWTRSECESQWEWVKKFKSFYRVFYDCARENFHSIVEIVILYAHSLFLFIGIKSDKPLDKPFFDEIYPRNVSTVVDDIAILKCVVKNKGDRTVSSEITSFYLPRSSHYLFKISFLVVEFVKLVETRRIRHIVLKLSLSRNTSCCVKI